MKSYIKWNENKINELLNFVDEYKKNGYTNIKAFNDYSKINNLDLNTVRNKYYKLLKLRNIYRNKYKKFSRAEEKELMLKINRLIDGGNSIRGSCYKLANNDKKLAQRYINKYRKLSKKVINNANIVKIKPKSIGLTDDDINNLIKGFILLIKKNTINDMNLKYKSLIKNYNEKLNIAKNEINKKNNLLKDIIIENENLKANLNIKNNNLDKLLIRVKN